MRISVAADERVGLAEALIDELRSRGHEPIAHGALAADERDCPVRHSRIEASSSERIQFFTRSGFHFA